MLVRYGEDAHAISVMSTPGALSLKHEDLLPLCVHGGPAGAVMESSVRKVSYWPLSMVPLAVG